VRRGRGRQHRSSSSAARLGMPTSKGKRSGCALRAVCARRSAWLCASSGQLRTRRLLPAYPVSTPAAVFASLGLADGPPSGWAARGASRTELLWGAHAGVRQPSRTLSSHRRNRCRFSRLYYIVWVRARPRDEGRTHTDIGRFARLSLFGTQGVTRAHHLARATRLWY
jgi:hypothetical protein